MSRLKCARIGLHVLPLLLVLVTILSAQQYAQAQCKVGSNAPPTGFWTWAKNSRIKVYLLTKDFKPEETEPVLAPLHTWNAVSALTGSGVILEYAGSTDEQQSCEKCLTIMRGSVPGNKKRHAAANLMAYGTGDQSLTYAIILIAPTLTNLKELTDVVAHELGHSFGLVDCYTCKSKSTVMNPFKGLNSPNEMPAPTACDVAQVAATYKGSKKASTAKLAKNRPTVEEGEEPVEDDTPIVIPKP